MLLGNQKPTNTNQYNTINNEHKIKVHYLCIDIIIPEGGKILELYDMMLNNLSRSKSIGWPKKNWNRFFDVKSNRVESNPM
ncbi:MAG: hypothetical protein Ta2E_12750 [Mycoplasmoidaceae bacterium]|nr:MAG: hypothetical protein Ta2E_12750 [Mycoplasmoidaceae bacterium]